MPCFGKNISYIRARKITKGFVDKKLPPKREYRLKTFGNCCLIVVRYKGLYLRAKIITKFVSTKKILKILKIWKGF